MSPRIYLAGPDVFYPDALERAAWMKGVCAEFGLTGVFPADVVIDPTGLSPEELAAAIFQRDVDLVQSCDIVAANLFPFRGAEPDSGTCFELGLGFALGKKLYGYTHAGTMADRVAEHYGPVDSSGARPVDSDGLHVENFGPPINLMISVPATMVYGSFEDCIRRIARDVTPAVIA
ncbi:nucleoside 2-deoxyribosyltransferase [Glaciihabitans sp. dw_435]|uniref:nucleoside 2-deoxyribosyltransferase n=1 Tax=Glaciihabitans sp. dw_435 TaxID=2720081 RepID=UPI001BD2BAD9|nr:nucleoside 2-deoxyribosyltransferase [Glaciihabitans sp. dw_435]